ncbi:MAG: hypothetical protein U0S48_16665 [Solirubrobacteraceae bacterium]
MPVQPEPAKSSVKVTAPPTPTIDDTAKTVPVAITLTTAAPDPATTPAPAVAPEPAAATPPPDDGIDD